MRLPSKLVVILIHFSDFVGTEDTVLVLSKEIAFFFQIL